MELYQLKYFKTVAETEHFTKAASILHISQPSLSKAISNLESELGVELFDRDKHSVYLNNYGKVFLKRVNHVLTELEEAQLELKEMSSNELGDVYIGSCTIFDEPSAVHSYEQSFLLSHPQVGLHMYIMGNAQIEEMLIARKIDLGLSTTTPKHLEIESIKLFSFRLGIVMSNKHPLATKSSIHLSELKEEHFLCNNTSPDNLDSVYQLCHKAGFTPKIIFEGEDSELIGDAIKQNIGVAFISYDRHQWKCTHTKRETDLKYLDVLDDYCIRTVYLYQLKDRYLSKSAQVYRNGLINFVKESSN